MLKSLSLAITLSLINAIKLEESFTLCTDDLDLNNTDQDETILNLEVEVEELEEQLDDCSGDEESAELLAAAEKATKKARQGRNKAEKATAVADLATAAANDETAAAEANLAEAIADAEAESSIADEAIATANEQTAAANAETAAAEARLAKAIADA